MEKNTIYFYYYYYNTRTYLYKIDRKNNVFRPAVCARTRDVICCTIYYIILYYSVINKIIIKTKRAHASMCVYMCACVCVDMSRLCSAAVRYITLYCRYIISPLCYAQVSARHTTFLRWFYRPLRDLPAAISYFRTYIMCSADVCYTCLRPLKSHGIHT